MARSIVHDARVALARRQPAEALRLLALAVEQDHAPAVDLANLIVMACDHGQAAAVAQSAEAAAARRAGSAALLAARAEVAARLGDLDVALRFVEEAAAAPDQDGMAQAPPGLLAARHLLAAGRLEAAAAAIAEVLAARPGHAGALALRAALQERQGDFAAAAATCLDLAQRSGADAQPWLRAVRLFLRAGQPDAAAAAGTQARGAIGLNAPLARDLAGALHGSGRFAEAAEIAAEGIAARPDGFVLHRQRILSLLADGRLEEARAATLAMIAAVKIDDTSMQFVGEFLHHLPVGAPRQAFLQEAFAAVPHPRIGGALGAVAREGAEPLALRPRAQYEQVIFPPDDVIPELAAIFEGTGLPFAAQMSLWGERRKAGQGEPTPVTACVLRGARLHVRNGLIAVIDREGELTDILFRRLSDEVLLEAREAAAERSLGSVFLVNGSGVRNYSLWCLDALPQIAVARARFPQAQVMVPGFRGARYIAPSLALFGLEGGAPAGLPDGSYAVEELIVLNASLHQGSKKGMQFGNRAYGRHLLDRLPARGPGRARRLFVDRPPPQRRTAINRAELLAVLARHGFEPIDPGALDVAEQAAAFAAASHVVGLHGAALANVIHCAPGTPVIEIHSPIHATATFAIASLVRGCPYRPLVGSSPMQEGKIWGHPQEVDFLVGTEELEGALATLAA